MNVAVVGATGLVEGEVDATVQAAIAEVTVGQAVQVVLLEQLLDGGPSRGGLASTIVDCTGEEPIILREGALGADEIREVVEAFRSQRVTTDRQTYALELPGEPHPDPTAEDTQR